LCGRERESYDSGRLIWNIALFILLGTEIGIFTLSVVVARFNIICPNP